MQLAQRASVILLILAAAFSGTVARADDYESLEIRVDEWLLLGPAPYSLPVFHDDDSGGFDLEDLLDSKPFDVDTLQPKAGGAIGWFETPLQWRLRAANKRGLLQLEKEEPGRTSIAWLAAWVTVDRWVEIDVELLGAHPRRAWIDGHRLASGGLDDEDDEVAGDAELTPGTHLLLVQTVRDAQRETRWSVGATLAVDDPNGLRLSASATRPRTVELRDVIESPRYDSLAVSPDGRRLAASFTRIVPGTDDTESWIEVRDLVSGTTVDRWREDRGAGQVDWSPDGKYLSYVGDVDHGDPSASLFLLETATGRSRVLLDEEERFGGYRWSPTSDAIAYWTSEEADDDRVVKRVESLMDRWSGFRNKHHLYLVSVPDGARQRLTAGPESTDLVVFSPDGARLLFTREIEDLDERPYSRSELWELELDGLRARKLRDFHWFDDADYSPDGKRLLIQTRAAEFGGAGVVLPADVIPNDYDSQLFIWTPETDEVTAITRDFDPSVERSWWSRRDGRIYLTAHDRDFVRFYTYIEGSRTFAPIETRLDVVTGVATADDAPVGVVRGSSPWHPEGLHTINLNDRTFGRRLPHAADAGFEGLNVGSVESWSFEASSGRTIDGRVYLPPGFDKQLSYPCIVYYYGGTVPVTRIFGGRYPKEWWASNGYVVYVLQPSGTIGYGQEFSSAHVNDWGGTTADEIIEGTKKFLDAHPYVDRRRVGAIGASYGGFMTMLLVTKPNPFATAVAHAGISSISSYWGEGYWGYSYSASATANSFPWNRSDIYVDRSPLFRADRVDTPILLTHGRSDTNVPVGESDAFFVALKLLGKTVEYVQVKGQDHHILDPEKRTVWSQTVLAWFDRWLKDRPEWWDSN